LKTYHLATLHQIRGSFLILIIIFHLDGARGQINSKPVISFFDLAFPLGRPNDQPVNPDLGQNQEFQTSFRSKDYQPEISLESDTGITITKSFNWTINNTTFL
jgi:hypothetical protein